MAWAVPQGLRRFGGAEKPGGNLSSSWKTYSTRVRCSNRRADGFLELFGDVPANDEDQLAEARAEGVVNRVVKEGLAGRVRRDQFV